MFKIPKKIEYALLALKYIAEHSSEECVNTKAISTNANIPHELTAKILQRLVKENIIVSQQGVRGGYVLNVSAEQLSVFQVIQAVDDEVMLTNCMFDGATVKDCERIENCCLKNPLNNIQSKINVLFSTTYLNEIIG
ncbi:MAG: Rrf2 family transcriptional regulator [Ignavibacteriae bacterium HGW-Ignavibacteriae-2]|jgi:Rrf2 family protein|nr:Rrf2 family transcriptional regulator [Bacteroidota bacterium]PKL89973.1 MAG: Rrf2 family transcriptional regulator [Ignavibacteriae bacterium HGW-Ignavibacteriae-2]